MNPVGSKVAVVMKPRKAEEGGIIFPEQSQKTNNYGQVMAVGPECKVLKAGDTVYIESHLGTHVVSKGVDYIIIEESKIPFKVEG